MEIFNRKLLSYPDPTCPIHLTTLGEFFPFFPATGNGNFCTDGISHPAYFRPLWKSALLYHIKSIFIPNTPTINRYVLRENLSTAIFFHLHINFPFPSSGSLSCCSIKGICDANTGNYLWNILFIKKKLTPFFSSKANLLLQAAHKICRIKKQHNPNSVIYLHECFSPNPSLPFANTYKAATPP